MAMTGSPEAPAYPRQRRAYGWVLFITGWVMRLVGGAVAALAGEEPHTAFMTASDPGSNKLPSPTVLTLLSIVAIVLGLALFGAGLSVGRRARRHLVHIIRSPAELGSRSYVLYLRPFRQDVTASGIAPSPAHGTPALETWRSGRTHEERLARMFREFGPMVTVGRPGENLPAGAGAYRYYLPRDDWRDPVRGLIDGARVILLGAGPGAGTVWEYTEVLRRADPRRLVVLVTDPNWYLGFQALSTAAVENALPELRRRYGAQWRTPALPGLPPPRRPKRKETFFFRAMIYFGRDARHVSLVVFDPSAMGNSQGPNKYLKKRVQPVLSHLRSAGEHRQRDMMVA
jgi:hypothetical protein